jgi:hypothetical protein
MNVGKVEWNGAALGDLLGFVEAWAGGIVFAADKVVLRGGEQALGEVVQLSGIAETVDGGDDMWQVERQQRKRARQHRGNQTDPIQCQVIEGDVEDGI